MPADTAAKDSAVGEEAASLARRDDDANATAKKKIDHISNWSKKELAFSCRRRIFYP